MLHLRKFWWSTYTRTLYVLLTIFCHSLLQHAGKKMYCFHWLHCTTYSHWQKGVGSNVDCFLSFSIVQFLLSMTVQLRQCAVRSKNVQFQSEWDDCRSNMLEILLPLSKYILAYYLHSHEVFETGITSIKEFYDNNIFP